MSGKADEVQVGKAVRSYLDKKGYRQAEHLMKDTSKAVAVEVAAFEMYNDQDSSLSNIYTLQDKAEINAGALYEVSYSKLKKWIEDSLDIFKNELFNLLYPIFVHCYLDLIAKGALYEAKSFMDHFKNDHTDSFNEDIQKLSCIMDVMHLKENQLAYTFRNNKYNLSLSSYSFDLFISFLQENGYTSLLKIVNQYLNIKVYSGKPKGSNDEELTMGIVGMSDKGSTSVNQTPVQWGNLPLDPQFEQELSKNLKEELVKAQRNPDQMQSILHQLKKLKNEPSQVSPLRTRIPLPPNTPSTTAAEIEKFKEMSKKANISKTQLPSICCYTFHNTYEGLCSVEFSPDSTLVAGGFADSFIEIWSLKGEKLKALKPSTELARMDMKDCSPDDLKETPGSDSKKLIGHSGPVYSTKFSTDNRFLISGSQDGSARLWSLDTFTNLVAYKGHNYPIWDVDYGPMGYYFATASADKTCRLWSTEYINPLRVFAGHLSDVDCVKFHPNSNYVATGSSDRTVRLWDVSSGSCVRLFTGHTAGVTSLAFSPDGKYLASGGHDKRITIWDLGSGKVFKKCYGHEKSIYSLSFSLDGSVIVSSAADCTVKVWDAKEEKASGAKQDFLASFPTKQTQIYATSFTYRNMVIVAGAFGV